METISISRLKARLSAELKRVRKGMVLTILDHKHPVARLVPLEDSDALFVREATRSYEYKTLEPLTDSDPTDAISKERADRW